MWVHLLSGDSIRFVDVQSEDGDVSNRFVGVLPSGHYVVESSYEDGVGVSVIEPRTGAAVTMSARPLASPSGRLLAAADPDAISDDVLTLWQLDSAGWHRVYAASRPVARPWAPHAVRWIDDSTLTLTQDYFDSTTSRLVVQHRAGRWRANSVP